MEFHAAANLFPLLTGEEFELLKLDIQTNGLLRPITTYQGAILDGRNRYRACEELGIVPEFQEYGGDSPTSCAVSLNLRHRHLTLDQIATIGLGVEAMYAVEAKERQREHGDTAPGRKSLVVDSPQVNGRARDKAADSLGISSSKLGEAKRIQRDAPELIPAIRSGEMTIPEAKREINRREREEVKSQTAHIVTPTGKFKTIIVDPPWEMVKIDRDARPNQFGFDYPTMSLQEIEDFDVPKDIADDECHLFLWTTQKYLPQAFSILSAWGFNYIFTMVWHKPGGFQPYNLPQYNCEFVLYGRKGSASFDDTKAFPTCFNAPRREHSRKPDEFYQLIERVCPSPRIDIFSRELRDGFSQYGIEPEKFSNGGTV